MAPTLSLAEKRRLFQDGYVVLPGFVSRKLIEGARHAINVSIGRGMNVVDMPRLRVRSFCPELREDPAMMALLLDSGLWEVGESLMGEGQVCEGSQGGAQINLRFPVPHGPRTPIEPHLDGMASRSNSVPTGELHSFTALIGVMLSEMPQLDGGNFTVWPGSHLSNAAKLRDQGPKSLLKEMPSITLPDPVQITGRAGDAVLTHYLLSHGTAPNWSCDVRYMIFFRLSRVDHQREKWASLVDPWLQWPALRELASSDLRIFDPNHGPMQVEAPHTAAKNDLSAARISRKYFRRPHRDVLTCGIKVTHDAAIALLDGNRLIFSVETEKLNSNPRHAGLGDAQRIVDVLASFGYSPDEVGRFVIDGWGIKATSLLNSTATQPTSRASVPPSETALIRLTDQGVPYDL